MARGYNGKVLFVNLTSGSVKEESLPEKVYRDFIGGQGLGARILYEHMKPKVDPLASSFHDKSQSCYLQFLYRQTIIVSEEMLTRKDG